MSQEAQKPTVGIQQQVVEKFLQQLREDKISASVLGRLEKVLQSGSVSEANIKKAMLPDESSS